MAQGRGIFKGGTTAFAEPRRIATGSNWVGTQLLEQPISVVLLLLRLIRSLPLLGSGSLFHLVSKPAGQSLMIALLRGERGRDGSHSRAFSAGTRDAWFQAGGMAASDWQVRNSISRHEGRNEQQRIAHSTGTTISLLRTIFSRLRAAASMARGSLRSLSTSVFNDVLRFRSCSTSV